jgi:hypothetical protein
MLQRNFHADRIRKSLAILLPTIFVIHLAGWNTRSQKSQSTASQSTSSGKLLNEANYYQSNDDTSDRAAELYRLIIVKYPNTVEAERAQFYLGTYYQKKFFILEHRDHVQDWSSFNQAEEALNTWLAKYSKGRHTYLADSYFTLATIALRRGDPKTARQMLDRMGGVASADPDVYIYKIVWSPRSDDEVKKTCKTSALAFEGTATINSYPNFDSFVTALRGWCLSNCR